jgi:D-alanyl-D-alanine carboxypeptidase/D-alanyl-D-alanine-endopeptidase (penicillin-binding protein 4)
MVAAALARSGIPQDAVGILVQPIGAAPLLAHNADTPFNPASVMKLVTTAAALDQLGPSHQFITRAAIEGELDGTTLRGTLYLQGGGDPALSQPRLWALLRELRNRGIQRVSGDLVLDASVYALPETDPAAFDGAPLRPYNAEPSGLMLTHNTVAVTLHPGPDALRVTLDPPVAPIQVEATINTHDACSAWREDRSFESNVGGLRVIGSYPLACGTRTIWLNLLPPAQNSLAHIHLLLRELGIVIEGQIRFGATPATAHEWLAWHSPPLAQLVADTNKWSNNLMAKALFLNLGLLNDAPPATWKKARQQMQAWLSKREIQGVVIENGAGLSRADRISAAQLGHLLDEIARQPYAPEFMASLPVWGRDGTLKTRPADHPAAGRARLKTGSLNGSRALAGFVHATDRTWIVVMLINHPRASQSTSAQEALLTWLLQAQTSGSD